jgi:hypothetical protein
LRQSVFSSPSAVGESTFRAIFVQRVVFEWIVPSAADLVGIEGGTGDQKAAGIGSCQKKFADPVRPERQKNFSNGQKSLTSGM